MKKSKAGKTDGCLKQPTYQWQERHFLARTENFRTGLWSALRIFYEYMYGFYVFRHVENCITIFGSARFDENHPYYHMARTMGYKLACAGFTVMTGGGPGIMEAANRGAQEGHGLSIGCNIRLPKPALEAANPYVDKRITLHYFFVRKVMLSKYSSAFIFMPGGFGTLDELFEMATLIQTHTVFNFPLILMGKQYWEPLMDFMRNTLLPNNTILSTDMERLLITDSPEEALNHIQTSFMKPSQTP